MIVSGYFLMQTGCDVIQRFWKVPSKFETLISKTNLSEKTLLVMAPDMEGYVHVAILANKNIRPNSLKQNALVLGNILNIIPTKEHTPLVLTDYLLELPFEVINQGIETLIQLRRTMAMMKEKWKLIEEAKQKSEILDATIHGTWFEEVEESRSEHNRRKRKVIVFYKVFGITTFILILLLVIYNIQVG